MFCFIWEGGGGGGGGYMCVLFISGTSLKLHLAEVVGTKPAPTQIVICRQMCL